MSKETKSDPHFMILQFLVLQFCGLVGLRAQPALDKTKGDGMAINVGIQTWCFREFKRAEAIARMKACGFSSVELAGIHADFADEAKFGEVINCFKTGGLQILSIGVQYLANNPGEEEKYFRFVRQAGAKFMSVDFDPGRAPDCYRAAEKLADKHDIRLAIHIHGRRHWAGTTQALKQVFQQTSPRIGLCLDTAWALDAGEDPIVMAETFADRLYGLHVKDFVFDRAGKPEDVVVGTGNLDLVKLRDMLRQVEFRGYAVLEYEGDAANPDPAVKLCAQAIRTAFGN